MDRNFKVKHFRSRIYNPIKQKILRAVLAVAAVGLLFAAGWFAYEPIMKSVMKANNQINDEIEIDKTEKTEVKEAAVLSIMEKENRLMTVPEETLYSALDFFDFLEGLPDGITGVVIDLKTKDGTVTYRSSQKSVIAAGAMSDNAVDLPARIRTARKKGLDVIARIYAFEDHIAPNNSSDLAIKYGAADGVLWLDNSFDEGGKPWMNPYSETAQKYIMDIFYDAAENGFDAVIMDGVRFPGTHGQQYAYYGGTSDTVKKHDILRQFMQRIYEAASGSQCDVILSYDSFEKMTGRENIYGGNPEDFICDGYAVMIDLSDYIGEKNLPVSYYRTMPSDVTKIMEEITGRLGMGENSIPVLVCRPLQKEQLAEAENVIDGLGTAGKILEYSRELFDRSYMPPEEEIPEPVYVPQYQPPAVSQPPVVSQPPEEGNTPEPEAPSETGEKRNAYPVTND